MSDTDELTETQIETDEKTLNLLGALLHQRLHALIDAHIDDLATDILVALLAPELIEVPHARVRAG